MPKVKSNLGVNYTVGRLPIKSTRVAVSGFNFQGNYRVFATYGYRLNKAKFYHKRRSRGNSVLIKKCR